MIFGDWNAEILLYSMYYLCFWVYGPRGQHRSPGKGPGDTDNGYISKLPHFIKPISFLLSNLYPYRTPIPKSRQFWQLLIFEPMGSGCGAQGRRTDLGRRYNGCTVKLAPFIKPISLYHCPYQILGRSDNFLFFWL